MEVITCPVCFTSFDSWDDHTTTHCRDQLKRSLDKCAAASEAWFRAYCEERKLRGVIKSAVSKLGEKDIADAHMLLVNALVDSS